MAQRRIHDYKAEDSTALFQERYRGIIRQGIYLGYNVCVGAEGGRRIGIRMDSDPDIDPVDSGTNGSTVNDGGANPRRFNSAGQNFLTTVDTGDILVIDEPAPNDTDNGEYMIVSVVDDTNVDIDRDWPSGGGGALVNLDYTIHQPLGSLRTPDGVVVEETACLDRLIDPAFTLQHDAGDPNPRIDLIIARYIYNAGAPPNVCSYMIIKGVPAVNPVPPAITDNDIILAEVYIPAGAGVILQSDIHSAAKMELYGSGSTDILDMRDHIFEPGIYHGFDINQGSLWTDVTIEAGSLLTPQFYKIREDTDLTDEVSFLAAAVGNHRYDWVICLHQWVDEDPVDNPIYMLITGTEVLLANDPDRPSDSDILTAIALVDAKYDSMDYVTKLGYVYITNIASEFYCNEKQLLPEVIRVSDGRTSFADNPTFYSGPEGLLEAVEAFHTKFETQLRDSSIVTDDGIQGTILLDGKFELSKTLIIPSCLAMKGQGSPAQLYNANNNKVVSIEGKGFNYVAPNPIFGATGAGGVAGLPGGYTSYSVTVAAGYQSGYDFEEQLFMKGDRVELYSPTAANVYCEGWIHEITAAWQLIIVVTNAAGDPDPTVDTDISMLLKKRHCELSNVFIDHSSSNNYVDMAGVDHSVLRDIQVPYIEIECLGECIIENIKVEISDGRLIWNSTTPYTNFRAKDGYSRWGGARNVYKNHYVNGSTWGSQHDIDSIFRGIFLRLTGTVGFRGQYNHFEDFHIEAAGAFVVHASYSHIGFISTSISMDLQSGADYNVINHIEGTIKLEAGAEYNKTYFASTYTDLSGNSTNVHYYDQLNIEPLFLRKSFQDYSPPAETNTGLSDHPLKNPRGLNLADGRGLWGFERIFFNGIESLRKESDGSRLVYGLGNKDIRIRFGGGVTFDDRISAVILTEDFENSFIEVTAVMTGIHLLVQHSETVAFRSIVDGSLTPNPTYNYYPFGGGVEEGATSSLMILGNADFSAIATESDIHTIRLYINDTGSHESISIHGIDIIRNDTVNYNVTELAGSIFSNRILQDYSMDRDVDLPTMNDNGGKFVRYISSTTHTKDWAITNLNDDSTNVQAGGVGGGATIPVDDASMFSIGDMCITNDADVAVVTNVVGNTLTVSPNHGGYAGGEVVLRYGHTCYLGVDDVDHDTENEEVVEIFHFRQFGSSMFDQNTFVHLNTTSGDKMYGVSDNHHCLVGNDVEAPITDISASDLVDGLDITSLPGDYLIFTFVGSGLALRRLPVGLATHDDIEITVDNVVINTIPVGATTHYYDDICAGLPYGTHTLKLERTTAVTQSLGIESFVVYAPKDPDFNGTRLYEGFVSATPRALGNGLLIPGTGLIRHDVRRELAFDGTPAWTSSYPVTARSGTLISTNLNAPHHALFRYFGSQICIRGIQGDLTIEIDGVDYTAMGFNALIGPAQNAYHYLYLTRNNTVNPTEIECIDVVTSSHAVILPYRSIGELFVVGSTALKESLATTPNNPLYMIEGSLARNGITVSYDDWELTNEWRVIQSSVCNINTQGRPVKINASITFSVLVAPVGEVSFWFGLMVDGRIMSDQKWEYRGWSACDPTDPWVITLHDVLDLEEGTHCAYVIIKSTDAAAGYNIIKTKITMQECS